MRYPLIPFLFRLTGVQVKKEKKSMPKKTGRTATKDLLKEIGLIKVKTEELKQIVELIPDSSVKDAFQYSVKNLVKKLDKFTATSEKIVLSDEEKEFIKKFRTGEISKEKILSTGEKKAENEISTSKVLKKQKTH
jgi:transcriptional regulator with GAF, ATPase, and Fis domain